LPSIRLLGEANGFFPSAIVVWTGNLSTRGPISAIPKCFHWGQRGPGTYHLKSACTIMDPSIKNARGRDLQAQAARENESKKKKGRCNPCASQRKKN